ncbi:MAG: division/cell wall cluster transcriptional repressor MraZ [Chthoniobacterales bacterium]
MSSNDLTSLIYAGTFERVMDGKHRVTIPAAWLAQGISEFHAIPNPSEECLIVMPPHEFQAIEERIHQSGAAAIERRKAIRQFYSRARAINADAQGRILFSEEQCNALKLQGEIVLVGGRSRFEIWNAKRWHAVANEEHDSFRNVANLIGL